MKTAVWAAIALGHAVVGHAQSTMTMAEDRARLAELTRDTVSFRASDSLLTWFPFLRAIPRITEAGILVVAPALRATYNSNIPFSGNDGAMWAGRGWSLSMSGGFAIERRLRGYRVKAQIAPELTYSQNRPFDMFPGAVPGRSAFSSPFHGPEASADVPLRFGDRHLLRVDAGRSRISVDNGAVEFGISTENERWGPGIRNAIIMSPNAAGIPRFFVGSARPVGTPLGSVRARLIAGTFTESQFFDAFAINDHRALSGLLVTLHPAFDSTLTVGFERVVYSQIPSSFMPMLSHAFDALLHWEYIAAPGDTTTNGRSTQRADQISALFARWIFPEAGFEVYGEWARMDLPKSGDELLVAPHHSGGYTFGFQWAQERSRGALLRLQAELTYLEQSRVFADRPPHDFYTSNTSLQGYTQRGQIVGAWIGPGGSSQWIAMDYMAPRWQAGTFIGRVRWENDAMYRQVAPTFFRHDATVFGGVRGGWRQRFTDVHLEATYGYRFNYLFQFGGVSPGGFRTVDKRNLTVAVTLMPR